MLCCSVQIADMVAQRAELGRNFGIVLVPEGLVRKCRVSSCVVSCSLRVGVCAGVHGRAEKEEGSFFLTCPPLHPPRPRPPEPHSHTRTRAQVEFLHDVSALIAELNELLASAAASGLNPADQGAIAARLTPESEDLFNRLPPGIKAELLEERDPHGNVQVGGGRLGMCSVCGGAGGAHGGQVRGGGRSSPAVCCVRIKSGLVLSSSRPAPPLPPCPPCAGEPHPD